MEKETRKKRKWGPIVLLYAFVLLICTIWIWWALLKGVLDSGNNENRRLAKLPQISFETIAEYPGEFTAFFNDNMPFRSALVAINSGVDYFVFNRSSSNKVIVGTEDNWLFYSAVDDGDPVACYQGTNLFTEEELERIRENLIDAKAYMEERGKEFVLFIAPNKERIYSEYMPEKYGRPAEEYRAKQLVDYLRATTDVRVVYPYEEIMAAKDKVRENIWYKADSHWNFVGSYVGTIALLKELGIDMPDIDRVEISDIRGAGGDLSDALNLSAIFRTFDREYRVSGYDDHDAEKLQDDFLTVMEYKATGADNRSIYVFRDSYCSYMAGYIGSQFNNSYFRHFSTYTYEDFLKQDPDIFVYEKVERYLSDLVNFSIW